MANHPVKTFTRRKTDRIVIIYFLLTYLISWSIWLLSGVLRRPEHELQDSGWLIAQAGVFGPYLAALITGTLAGIFSIRESMKHVVSVFMPALIAGLYTMFFYTDYRSFDLADTLVLLTCFIWLVIFYTRSRFRSGNFIKGKCPMPLMLSLILIPGVFFAGWYILVAGSKNLVEIPFGGFMPFVQFLILRFSLNFILGGSLGEEFGWRGFALPLLLKNNSPLLSSLIIGIGWALWHIPIDLVAGFGLQGAMAIILRIIFLLSLSIIFTAVYLKSRYRIFNMLLMHTSINILSDFGLKCYDEAMHILFLSIVMISIVIILLRRKLLPTRRFWPAIR